MKRISAILLALLLAGTCVGCGEAVEDTTADTAPVSGETTAETADEGGWQYPAVNYDGAAYRVLNFDQLWNMYIHVDAAELTGEALNDAVYNRNRTVEEKLNVVIDEKTMERGDAGAITLITDHAQTTIMAGLDEYDVMMLPVNQNISLVTEGYFTDLAQVDGLHLSETWWDQDIIDAVTLDGKLYFTSGSANLMAFEAMWCLYFNENLLADNGLDKPYDLVREGKWTIDKLSEYCAAVANLNGDTAFAWDKNGSCFWGISSLNSSPEKFLFSSGVRYTTTDGDGNIVFGLENDHFYTVIDKLANLLDGSAGMTLKANSSDLDVEKGGYVHVFQARRSLFLTGEVKAAQLLRDMDDTFGIVPFPKADEAQESYMTNLAPQLFYLTIPTTNRSLDMTANVSEVLAHDSFEKVIPVYYSNVVEHKGLRNEESVEMLEIMRQTRAVDIGIVYSWAAGLNTELTNKLFNGDNQVASVVASQKPAVEAAINSFMEFLKK